MHDPDLSRLLHALADPTGRSILSRLAEGPSRRTRRWAFFDGWGTVATLLEAYAKGLTP
jgi:DNA-binding transcriptional ArsR family regulator